MRPDLELGALCLITSGPNAGICITLQEFVGTPPTPPWLHQRWSNGRTWWKVDRDLTVYDTNTDVVLGRRPYAPEFRLVRIDNYKPPRTFSSNKEDQHNKVLSDLMELFPKKTV